VIVPTFSAEDDVSQKPAEVGVQVDCPSYSCDVCTQADSRKDERKDKVTTGAAGQDRCDEGYSEEGVEGEKD
jgi:hypothetical protein